MATSGILKGWDAIDDYMEFPRGTMMRRHGPEMRSCGVVHYTRVGRQRQTRIRCFKGTLERWVMLKAQRGEFL